MNLASWAHAAVAGTMGGLSPVYPSSFDGFVVYQEYDFRRTYRGSIADRGLDVTDAAGCWSIVGGWVESSTLGAQGGAFASQPNQLKSINGFGGGSVQRAVVISATANSSSPYEITALGLANSGVDIVTTPTLRAYYTATSSTAVTTTTEPSVNLTLSRKTGAGTVTTDGVSRAVIGTGTSFDYLDATYGAFQSGDEITIGGTAYVVEQLLTPTSLLLTTVPAAVTNANFVYGGNLLAPSASTYAVNGNDGDGLVTNYPSADLSASQRQEWAWLHYASASRGSVYFRAQAGLERYYLVSTSSSGTIAVYRLEKNLTTGIYTRTQVGKLDGSSTPVVGKVYSAIATCETVGSTVSFTVQSFNPDGSLLNSVTITDSSSSQILANGQMGLGNGTTQTNYVWWRTYINLSLISYGLAYPVPLSTNLLGLPDYFGTAFSWYATASVAAGTIVEVSTGSALRAAIEAPGSTAKIIRLTSPGVYDLGDTQIEIKRSCVIEGTGESSIIQIGTDQTTTQLAASGKTGIRIGSHNVGFRNVTVECKDISGPISRDWNFTVVNNYTAYVNNTNPLENRSFRTFFVNVNFDLKAARAVALDSVEGFFMNGCKFVSTSTTNSPFRIGRSKNVRIENVDFDYCANRVVVAACDTVSVRGCRFIIRERVVDRETGALDCGLGRDLTLEGNSFINDAVVDTNCNDMELILTQSATLTEFQATGEYAGGSGLSVQTNLAFNVTNDPWISSNYGTSLVPHRRAVIVLSGAGAGQMRLAYSPSTYGTGLLQFTIEEPWGIVPASGDKIAIFSLGAQDMKVYRNYIENARQGVSIYSGGTGIDIRNNFLFESGCLGARANLRASTGDVKTQNSNYDYLALWNTRIVGNAILKGNSGRPASVSLSLIETNETATYFATLSRAINRCELSHNLVYGTGNHSSAISANTPGRFDGVEARNVNNTSISSLGDRAFAVRMKGNFATSNDYWVTVPNGQTAN